MRPHPRIRKTIKWGGAAVTLLLVVVWVRSEYVIDGYSWRHGDIHTEAGALHLLYCPKGWSVSGLRHDPVYDPPAPPDWGWRSEARVLSQLWVLPLWMPATLAFGAASTAWRLDTLARRRACGGLTLCPKCNYDRAGIAADAKCPECGALPVAGKTSSHGSGAPSTGGKTS
ncbi:MAG TPA: hypothetical protein VHC70_06960 [Phycisphaerales bacterium]|nr:hypothetical protein [Phycisphaerales bacterium]